MLILQQPTSVRLAFGPNGCSGKFMLFTPTVADANGAGISQQPMFDIEAPSAP
ncbi:MAG: hypothetical protein ACKV2U_30225 [Bryobacteraceae bacterium]